MHWNGKILQETLMQQLTAFLVHFGDLGLTNPMSSYPQVYIKSQRRLLTQIHLWKESCISITDWKVATLPSKAHQEVCKQLNKTKHAFFFLESNAKNIGNLKQLQKHMCTTYKQPYILAGMTAVIVTGIYCRWQWASDLALKIPKILLSQTFPTICTVACAYPS